MEVDKEAFNTLLEEHAGIAATKENVSWVFGFSVDDHLYSETLFNQFVGHMRGAEEVSEELATEVLTVTPTEGGSLLKVYGLNAMSRYCVEENLSLLDAESHKWVQRTVQASATFPDELPVLVRSDITEIVDSPKKTHLTDDPWINTAKHYSIERTFKYKYKDVCVYCVRMVKETADSFVSMQEANVSSANTKYIYELHWFDFKAPPAVILSHVVRMGQILTNNALPTTKTRAAEVLAEYGSLIAEHTEKYWKDPNKVQFMAPKPVTLEQKHLVAPSPETYGNTSIWNGYCVTDKADGERMLLYVASNGEAFFINSDLDVRRASFKIASATKGGTLIDGEYIHACSRKGIKRSDLFAAFDIYFFEGEDVYKYPLMTKKTEASTISSGVHESSSAKRAGKTRNDILLYACNKRYWQYTSHEHEIVGKTHSFAEGDDMRDACRALLAGSTNLSYDIDGLIFTPAELGVCGYYPGRYAKFPMSMRWDMVYKWKPEEQNTIDFLVEEISPPIRDHATNNFYKRFSLLTGYNVSQLEPLSVKEGLRKRYDYKRNDKYSSRFDYIKRKFEPVTFLEPGIGEAFVLTTSNDVARCKDGSHLANDTIVEFAYDMSEDAKSLPASKRWIPLRVREDKTRTYQRGKKNLEHANLAVSKTANDFTVASSVWRTIHQPVTIEMLTGAVEITAERAGVPDTLDEKLLSTDDVYYAREVPRQHLLSVHMLNFHNNGVKAALYEYSKRRDSLLELACGKAGDMMRWRDCEYSFVLGIDLAKDNICKASDGAYARMLNKNATLKKRMPTGVVSVHLNHVFAIGDCSLPLHDGSCTEDPDSKELLNILYKKHARSRIDPIYAFINGAAMNGFSVVSCQFAIHYFFQNEEQLDGFLDNVARNLKPGGIFITTFMDGQLVNNLIADTGLAQGIKLNGRARVWAITKNYNDYQDNDAYGKRIGVYLENTGKSIPEFLVHTPTLIAKLKQRGIVLEKSELFSNNYYEILQNKHSSRAKTDVLALEDDDVQKQFSFLNRWMIFRKE